jgi:phage baseplate assembly protein W
MTFGAKKIFPIDTKPGTAVGIAIPFNAPATFFPTYTTKDAIRNNLLNFFLTNSTERYLNNEFGANIKAFIFEQINNDSLSFLKDDIQTKINQYFPNIEVNNIEVTQPQDTNIINVSLNYSIPYTNISDKLEITL